MQTTMLIQREIQDTKNKLTVQLKEIYSITMQVCCFGGNNWSKPKELTKILNGLLDEVYKLKNLLTINIENLNIPKEAKLELKNAVSKLKTSSSCFGISLDKWDHYFQKSFNESVYINPDVFPIILESMGQMIAQSIEAKKDPNSLPFYTNFQKLKTYNPSDFETHIAYLTYHWTMKVKSPAVLLRNREEEIKIGSHYSIEKKMEPTDEKHRALLIQYLVNDIKFGPFYFGIGNCQLMAELAFLLGIQTLSSTPIRSVQFQHSEGKFEELNAIVVGNWPTPGCIVLAPWYSQESFEWKGALDKTPEMSHYDTTSVLFTVKDQQEQTNLQQLLSKLNFNIEKLLENPNRSNFLKYIQDKSEKIYELIKEKDKLDYQALKN